MSNEQNKLDDKTSIANFNRAMELGFRGYVNLDVRCKDIILTTDVCRENGKLGGMPVMKPYAFVRNLPETGYPYIILISKGKMYNDPNEPVFYKPGYAYVFRICKNQKGAYSLVDCGTTETQKVIDYTEENDYWSADSKENSR